MLGEAGSTSSQAAIASALGMIGDRGAIDALTQMLNDDQGLTQAARGFAAVALGVVCEKQDLPWNSMLSVHVNYRANTDTLTNGEGTGILNIL